MVAFTSSDVKESNKKKGKVDKRDRKENSEPTLVLPLSTFDSRQAYPL